MAIQTKSAVKTVPDPQDNGNAILLDAKLVDVLTSTINKLANSFDIAASRRECIDAAVSEMSKCLKDQPFYYAGPRCKDGAYKYFGSEISAKIAGTEGLTDKGRYVEACIVGYLQGVKGLTTYCKPARKIRPRKMSQQEREELVRLAAATAEVMNVDSEFRPTTHLGEL